MELYDIARAKQAYDAQRKMLEPVRFAQMEEYRSQFGEELALRLDKRFTLEEHMAKLGQIDLAVNVLEKILAGEEVDGAVFREALGVEKEAYETYMAALDPVIAPVPEKLVLMTFDDATLDHYTTVAPLFEKYGGKANFFVCETKSRMGGGTGFEDKSHFMDWDQIRELYDRGHEIVNHSLNHEMEFYGGSDDYVREEIRGIGIRCGENGIRAPIAFGYPGGRCTPRHERILHEEGYQWARGDMKEVPHVRAGQSYYDPYMDSPLAMPSYNGAPGFDEARIAEVLSYAKDGRVLIFAYHSAEGREFRTMTLEDQIRCIYENGGRCITYTELSRYIDPARAYAYTHLS